MTQIWHTETHRGTPRGMRHGYSSPAAPRRTAAFALAAMTAIAMTTAMTATPARAQNAAPAPAAAPVLAAAPAPANPRAVQISSVIQVERVTAAADGRTSTTLVSPEKVTVVPGDKLLFTLGYTNTTSAPAANFVAVNPIDPSVAFTGVTEDWAELSVDGGKSWGKLSQLTVLDEPAAPGADAADTVADERSGEVTRPATQPVAPRPARAEDVTHVRWKFAQPIPAGGTGELSFRGVVR